MEFSSAFEGLIEERIIHSYELRSRNSFQLYPLWIWEQDCTFSLIYLNINQLDALNFIISLFHASTCFEHCCAHRQEIKLHYTASGIITLKQVSVFFSKITKITKITKIQFYKYEQTVVKFMCEFFRCDYCVLLTINML